MKSSCNTLQEIKPSQHIKDMGIDVSDEEVAERRYSGNFAVMKLMKCFFKQNSINTRHFNVYLIRLSELSHMKNPVS